MHRKHLWFLLFIFLIELPLLGKSQNFKFIDADSIMNILKNDYGKSIDHDDIDLNSIALIDSCSLPKISKYFNEMNIVKSHFKIEKRKYINTKLQEIKKVFMENEEFKLVLEFLNSNESLDNITIDNRILVKENREAILLKLCENRTEYYRVKKSEQGFTIELAYIDK